MSKLDDRLVNLAAAEHLTIVIDSVWDDPQDGASARIDQSLQRARLLPRTAVWDCFSPATRHVLRQPVSRGLRFVASGSEEAAAFMSSLRDRDVGVSVGRTVAGAALRIDEMDELASILERLVSTRSNVQAPDASRTRSRSHGSPLLSAVRTDSSTAGTIDSRQPGSAVAASDQSSRSAAGGAC